MSCWCRQTMMPENVVQSSKTPSPVMPDITVIKAISFDLDDTLWHCAPAIQNAENALYEWHRRETPLVTVEHSRQSLAAYRMGIRARYPELAGDVTEMRLVGLRELLREFGYRESLAAQGFDVFYRARSEVQLYEGVIEMLEALGRRYKLAAITNGNADLGHIGIEQHFNQVHAANLVTPAKPAPAMFERCLQQFDLPAAALLHIGDNPVADVVGGHNAGVQTLWFNQLEQPWPEQLPQPHFQARTLSEIIALLA